jgi:mevalonate kinase
MSRITYSVPIPFFLIGEEGIIYGKPAIGIALSYFVKVTVEKTNTSIIFSPFDNLISLVDSFIRDYLKRTDKTVYKVTVSSDFDFINKQIESACIVGLVSAILELYTNKIASVEEVNKVAFSIEKKLNPKTNGFAISICTLGSIVYYRKEFEFLKAVHSLPINIPKVITDNLFIHFVKIKPFNLDNKIHEDVTFFEKYLLLLEKYTKRIIVSFMKEDVSFFQTTYKEYMNLRDKMFHQSLPNVLSINHNMTLCDKKEKGDIPMSFSTKGTTKIF